MNCEQFLTLVSAYADDEVDALRHFAMNRHLQRCAACSSALAKVVALRARVRREVPYFEASPALTARMRAIAQSVAAPARPSRRRWVDSIRMGDGTSRWFAGGAIAGCAATVLAWMLGTTVIAWQQGDQFATAAVASHVHATLNDHLIDVASSDRHTVKPWLSARLDYSPPVQDLSEEGFALVGGRLDNIDRQPVATLVYRYREHTIDVFVRPVGWHVAMKTVRSVRGFNVVHADGTTMEWFAVSDAEPGVLSRLVQRLAHDDTGPVPTRTE